MIGALAINAEVVIPELNLPFIKSWRSSKFGSGRTIFRRLNSRQHLMFRVHPGPTQATGKDMAIGHAHEVMQFAGCHLLSLQHTSHCIVRILQILGSCNAGLNESYCNHLYKKVDANFDPRHVCRGDQVQAVCRSGHEPEGFRQIH